MTHAAIAVRDATPADLDTIVDFNDRLAFESEGRRLNLAVIRPGVDAVLRDRAKGRYFVALVDGHLAGGGCQNGGEAAHQGGLARPVGSEHDGHPTGHPQVDAVEQNAALGPDADSPGGQLGGGHVSAR